MICIFVFQILSVAAQSNQVHTVRKGDTLYQLSKTYHVTVDQIKQANKLTGNNLSLGQKLKIPGKAIAQKNTEKTKKVPVKSVNESNTTTSENAKIKTQKGTSFPDFNKLQEKPKPGLAEGLLQKTKELMGEKPAQVVPETQQTAPETPAVTTINVIPIPKEGYHIVKAKENLFRISKMYGLDMKEIMSLNNMDNYSIKKGQKIKLVSEEQLKVMQANIKQQKEDEVQALNQKKEENKVPEKIKVEQDSMDLVEAYHIVQRHETLSSISRKYNIAVEELRRVNNLSNNKIFVGQKIYLKIRRYQKPVTEIEPETEQLPQLKDPSRLRNDLVRPVIGHVISSFGLRQSRPHKGLDIGAPSGTPIYSVLDGRVVYAGMQSGYGNVIVIEHPDFVMTVYAHNERNLVEVGDNIQQGQQIALVGSTGNATASHLHFEYRVKGKAIDPKKVLPDY